MNKNKALVAEKISSSYQLLSFLSYWKANRNKFKEAHVHLEPYWKGDQIPERYFSLCKDLGVEYTIESNAKEIKYLKENYDIVILSVNSVPWKFSLKHYIVGMVVVADGLGTYTSFFTKLSAVEREKGTLNFFGKFSFFFRYIINLFFGSLISCNNYMLFDKSSLRKNKVFLDELRSLILSIECNQFDTVSNTSIFISQPFVSLGLINESEYIEILKKLRNRASEIGLDFAVKIHPAESKSFYSNNEIKLIEFDGVIEEFAIKNPDNEFSSILSSALITLQEICLSPVYRIVVDGLNEKLNINRKQEYLINQVPKLKL